MLEHGTSSPNKRHPERYDASGCVKGGNSKGGISFTGCPVYPTSQSLCKTMCKPREPHRIIRSVGIVCLRKRSLSSTSIASCGSLFFMILSKKKGSSSIISTACRGMLLSAKWIQVSSRSASHGSNPSGTSTGPAFFPCNRWLRRRNQSWTLFHHFVAMRFLRCNSLFNCQTNSGAL